MEHKLFWPLLAGEILFNLGFSAIFLPTLRRSTPREVPNQRATLSLTHRPKQKKCLKQTWTEQHQCLSQGKLVTKSGRTKGHIYVGPC